MLDIPLCIASLTQLKFSFKNNTVQWNRRPLNEDHSAYPSRTQSALYVIYLLATGTGPHDLADVLNYVPGSVLDNVSGYNKKWVKQFAKFCARYIDVPTDYTLTNTCFHSNHELPILFAHLYSQKINNNSLPTLNFTLENMDIAVWRFCSAYFYNTIVIEFAFKGHVFPHQPLIKHQYETEIALILRKLSELKKLDKLTLVVDLTLTCLERADRVWIKALEPLLFETENYTIAQSRLALMPTNAFKQWLTGLSRWQYSQNKLCFNRVTLGKTKVHRLQDIALTLRFMPQSRVTFVECDFTFQTGDYLSKLSTELYDLIERDLPLRDVIALSKLSIRMQSLFSTGQKKPDQLMIAVERSYRPAFERIFHGNIKALVTQVSLFKDTSGREFIDASPWMMALWICDTFGVVNLIADTIIKTGNAQLISILKSQYDIVMRGEMTINHHKGTVLIDSSACYSTQDLQDCLQSMKQGLKPYSDSYALIDSQRRNNLYRIQTSLPQFV